MQGRVEVPAAKNSVLPLLAAALLCSGPVRLQNVPRLTDVEDCLALLRGVGCTAGWQGTALAVHGPTLPEAAAGVHPALLARLGRVSTVLPGGCRIGARPIDLHLQGLAQMGVRQLPAAPGQLTLYAPAGLRGGSLSFPSVGATETLLLAAATAGTDRAAWCRKRAGDADLATSSTPAAAAWRVGHRHHPGAGKALPCGLAPMADRIIASTLACARAAAAGRQGRAGGSVLYAPLLEILEQMGCTICCRHFHRALRGAGNDTTLPALATDAAPLLAAIAGAGADRGV